MGVYQRSLRKLWEEWNMPTLVLLSLTFQILLTCLGSRRKYNRSTWIRVVVWSAYLMADTVATLALGSILSTLHDIYDDYGKVIPNVELNAFWAPFLLLHLGGPDTITAYALEDNQLWLRHLLGLVGQTAVALYVILLAWTGSCLSILSIFIILVGTFKYGERIWVLWLASNELLGNIFPDDDDGDFYNLDDLIPISSASASQEGIIYMAYRLIGFYMPRIVGKISGSQYFDIMGSILNGPTKGIRKLIEVELGFMYDLLYTKAKVVYTPYSLILRLIGFSITCLVLMLFSIGVIRRNNYSKVDLTITFVLLAGAIAIDLYSAFLIFSSNWSTALLYQHAQKHPCHEAIANFQKSLNRSPLWSNSVAQFSLLRFSFGEKKHVRFGSILKHFARVHKKLKQKESITYVETEDILNEQFINKVMSNEFWSLVRRLPLNTEDVVVENRLTKNLFRCIEIYKKENLIIVWHIATELCYYLATDTDADADAEAATANYQWEREISIHISQYIMYLFVRYPSMFSGRVAEKMFKETCKKARDAYKEGFELTIPSIRNLSDYIPLYNQLRSHHQPKEDVVRYFKGYLEKDEEFRLAKSIFTNYFAIDAIDLIPPAVWISLNLDEISDMKLKWEMISNVWLQLLLFVASQWSANEHGQQLRRGGELITHVSLLMLHMGGP